MRQQPTPRIVKSRLALPRCADSGTEMKRARKAQPSNRAHNISADAAAAARSLETIMKESPQFISSREQPSLHYLFFLAERKTPYRRRRRPSFSTGRRDIGTDVSFTSICPSAIVITTPPHFLIDAMCCACGIHLIKYGSHVPLHSENRYYTPLHVFRR